MRRRDSLTAGAHSYVRWSSSAAIGGKAFPRWRGSFFVGSLKQRDLFRITVDGDRETLRETVLHDVHRIRDIATDRDGLVYVLTHSGDLLRLAPTR
jgi:glucose/arabinose dehydrogenase